jgi:hypothetical protein
MVNENNQPRSGNKYGRNAKSQKDNSTHTESTVPKMIYISFFHPTRETVPLNGQALSSNSAPGGKLLHWGPNGLENAPIVRRMYLSKGK